MIDESDAMPDETSAPDEMEIKYDDETIIWEGGPSQWVNLGTYLWWTVFITAAIKIKSMWDTGVNLEYPSAVDEYVSWGCWALLSISIYCVANAFLSVRYEKTIITKNKIKEEKGITSIFRTELFCEISDITDIKSPAPGIMGVLGLSTLVIETNDTDQPIITIRAIRNRSILIDKLLPIWRKLKIERKGYFGER
jgi:hypothetical protein